MSTTAPERTFLPAGEYRAEEIPVGVHVLYGTRDVGRVSRVERMHATTPSAIEGVRSGFLNWVPGQPVIKFELACSGGRLYYFVRFPHEPVTIVEV